MNMITALILIGYLLVAVAVFLLIWMLAKKLYRDSNCDSFEEFFDGASIVVTILISVVWPVSITFILFTTLFTNQKE